MGYIVRVYGCSECGVPAKVFQPREEGPPDTCPNCGAGGDAVSREAIPSTTGIKTAASKGPDDAYRQVERTSEARAEAAGDPSLKVTNLKDNLREGDVAGVAPNNAVTQFMDQTGFKSFGVGGPATGIDPKVAIMASKSGRDLTTGQVGLQALQTTLGTRQITPGFRKGLSK